MSKIKYKLDKNDIMGRFLTADCDITEGELILFDRPIIVVPKCSSSLCCSNCFDESNRICKKCRVFPLCFECTNHNQFECTFFADIYKKAPNFLINNYDICGVLKCLLLGENDETNHLFEKLLQMESHTEKRMASNIWNLTEKIIVEPILNAGLQNYLKKVDITSKLIQKIAGVLDVNAFEIRTKSNTARGIYARAALLAHNCIPNTFISVSATYQMKIYASVPIHPDSIIYYNYTNPLWGTNKRRADLKAGKYFDCCCERCVDPTELGTHMSSLKCHQCMTGFIIENDTIWNCNNCSNTIRKKKVTKMLENIESEVSNANNNGDLQKLELLIKENCSVLSPNHYILIDLKQNVASMLRILCYNLDKPIKDVLKRKIQLCSEIIPVLKIIQPGISRYTAIAMYEYITPYLQELSLEYLSKTISPSEYYVKLESAESILKECIKILLYDYTDTPEGQLAKKGLGQLKILRNNMAQIKNLINKTN